jgi:hypothetical protein
MRIRIAAITIALLLLLLLAAYATRHHYEHGPNEALFRINRYTGETCRLTFTTPELKAKSGNENPLDELNPHLAVGSYAWASCGK